MLRISNLRLSLDHTNDQLLDAAARALKIAPEAIHDLQYVRRGIDARGRGPVCFSWTVDVAVDNEDAVLEAAPGNVTRAAKPVWSIPAAPSDAKRPVVVGSGPAGLFAALALAEAGLAPLVLERGKPVPERSADVARFWLTGQLDTASNASFGEGGAGTFSDGKLTTRIKDREGRGVKVLEEMIRAGAPEEIRWTAKPHVGTDLLRDVVVNLRKHIESLGGTVRFNAQVEGLRIEDGAVRGVVVNGEEIETDAVVLAIGHSARDTYEHLAHAGVAMERKAFAIGVRIEHPQALINKAQYGKQAGHPLLGAADYQLAEHQKNGRSVYTFCMCPGGEVMAAATEPGGVVTNGMSHHARGGENANSALLVQVQPEDYGNTPDGTPDVLAGVLFQRRWEQAAFRLAGANFHAPAQLLGDFLKQTASTGPGDIEPTYRPGVVWTDLKDCLPKYALAALRRAIPGLARRLRGFNRPDAVLTGLESRTSAPVRLLRTDEMESQNTRGLYPAGEGAGYAGGIMSAAIDGLRAAEAICARKEN